MSKKIYSFTENSIKFIALIPLLLLSILVTVFQNNISFDIIETSTIEQNGWSFLLLVVAFLFAFAIAYQVVRRIPEKLLFAFFALAYFFGGLYLITHIQMELRYDSGICYWNALNFAEGNYTNLQPGEYFYKNPHQLGLTGYNTLLIKISSDPNFVYFTNLIWILLSNFFIWRIAVLLYSQHVQLRKIIIIFSYLFLPHFFYLFYAYGQVPGLGCIIIATYFTVKALQSNRYLYMVAGCIFIGFACLLRMNYVIAGIALLIIYILYTIRHTKLLSLLAVAGLLFCIIIPRNLMYDYYEKVADTDLAQGMSPYLYIAMGLQENEEPWRAAGWYNSFNDNTYLASGFDKHASGEIALDSIRERLQTFADNPKYAIDFFGEKIITTWCDPTYQSIWSGPLISMNCTTEVPWLHNLYSGGSIFWIYASLTNVVTVMLFGFSLMYVAWNLLHADDQLNTFELFALLFFMGGFFFHLFWETKSQYVYPHVVLLIPLAARGILLTYEFLHEQHKRRFLKTKNS